MLLFACILENKLVVAQCWGVLNLDKVLIVPGGQAISNETLLYLVDQSLVAYRTSPVTPRGELAASGKNKV